jgi:hypothetical protein
MNSKCSKETLYFLDTAVIAVAKKMFLTFWGISSFDSKDTTLFGVFY